MNIRYDKAAEQLYIIDQSLLPNEEKEIRIQTASEMYDAIKKLKVRGAPAIGIFAAFALYSLARSIPFNSTEEYIQSLRSKAEYLSSSRPTAVNLSWALSEMLKTAENNISSGREAVLDALYSKAEYILNDDIARCRAISEFGLSLLKDGDGILTHCNAGPLATSKYGTALGPILLGKEQGYEFHVYSDETRPLLQGARLTCYELYNAGVDITLICDNMASSVMKEGRIQACLVGCDRVAANGDTANKIGTSGVAVLSKHYNIPFYVLGPCSTIDMNCPDGDSIPIELRSPDEIKTLWYEKPMAPAGVKCYNPSFDVTDHSLITAIITEKGICYPPFTESLKSIMEGI